MPDLNIDKIYYLGPNGSYTHKALEIFVSDFSIKYESQQALRTIKSILKAVDKNEFSYGVLPIENSIEGIVRESIDNLIRVGDIKLKIIAEVVLPVDHCLLSKSSDKSTIKTVISHPQALAQCSNYLDENFHNINILEETSTSAAAKRVSDLDETYGAISNEMAAKFFDLNILDKSINDEKDNKTRFLLIGRYEFKPTGSDKTSIAFSTKNTAGALFKVLNIFNKHQINLLYIDSRPSKKNLGEYNFFIDFEGHILDEKVRTALEEVRPLTSFYRLNGSFPIYKK